MSYKKTKFFYPKKVKPMNINANKITKDSLALARTGIALGFLGLTIGVAAKAFKK